MDPLAFKLELLDASAELTGYIGTQQLANDSVTEDKISFPAASTGKAIAMAIVFGG